MNIFLLPNWFSIYVIIPVATGVISGYVANGIYVWNEKRNRANRIEKELRKYVGDYDVYHLKNLKQPDECGYKISIALEEKNGILKITQTGTLEDDELTADIKINEFTFNYGEGSYMHPKKKDSSCGKMSIFLIDEHLINVDKIYVRVINSSAFIQESEKWQWRK